MWSFDNCYHSITKLLIAFDFPVIVEPDVKKMSCKSPELTQKIEEWLAWDRNEKTLAVVKQLVAEENYEKLGKILLSRLSFGTAGLRGKMAAGYSNMNDLVIIQTAQGLLKYLENTDKEFLKSSGIVIGYDGRHNSKR